MSNIFSIGFYNLENLFDHRTESANKDHDYTSKGYYAWNESRYNIKIENLSHVISEIGTSRSDIPPIILGVCEVENLACLDDLVNSTVLKPYGYGYIFKQSQDLRGINVALLYQKQFFEPLAFKSFSIEKIQDKTRDILAIKGKLLGQNIHIIVNHWPSRTDGIQKTNIKREEAAKLLWSILSDIYQEDKKAQVIILGDFNDDPDSKSVRSILNNGHTNLMESFQKNNIGSVKFRGKWKAFDQIILNSNLLDSKWFQFLSTHVFCKPYLTQKTGRYKGSPKRTFIGNYHLGGYSDHYPVFIYFQG